ncbi:heavy metal translocating P-type ATPase [Acidithiobacillus ferrivorans SS3]|uniref:P-type Zn(2+) transporter n=1 Tax=Acidithiobacillus ferrivorans SS3 TaxID=743299 RepID=G0JMI1_9PROT|nr:cation-translocating P-type ATPase [Acidithiobacillus ferrivorans]AEM47010.1 heavy metal translocating P-type ATPase [Acidithiobacillus ferrivorans SS3]OFA15006.1 ATPase P [Acidithiobacillus ferrivorans]
MNGGRATGPSSAGCGSQDGCGCGSALPGHDSANPLAGFSRTLLWAFGLIIAVVVLLVVAAEQLGMLDVLTEFVPWPVWFAAVLAGGWPIFRNVLRATLRRKITSHTLMTIGLAAAIVAGAWPAAVLIVFFMRLADYIEYFTAEHARQAVRDLTALAPETARVEREGREVQVPIEQVQVGETVIVRPGEKTPVDGEVIGGHATVNQAAITGESMPVEAGPGARVFAAGFVQLGHLRIRVTAVGKDTTFGRVIQLVAEAEQHRAPIQRVADKFAAWYLPVVVTVATGTFLASGKLLATTAVLVVACSCSFTIATPVAVIASIGASARRGLLIKGGRYLEVLAKATVVVLDKTGTLTLGRPVITDVIPLDADLGADEVLRLAATAERYSEHPLAEAVRGAAALRELQLAEPQDFEAIPGMGVRVRLDGESVLVGGRRLLAGEGLLPIAAELEAQGKTLLFVIRNGQPVGVLAAMDTLRPDVPEALAELRRLGVKHLELLTGDNERTAAAIAAPLGIHWRAQLLPEDKIAVVKEYQRRGHVVVMIGDGVNDAPALAQADVGIAMGAAGSPLAIEAAHIALLRDDWKLVPEVLRIARRTMNTVKINIGFTAVYNLAGLALAALGFLPPAMAAAAQAGPDFGILANSARLLHQGGSRQTARSGRDPGPAALPKE